MRATACGYWQESCMKDQRNRWRRRLTGGLVAALLGTAAALTVVTPAHADLACTVTVRAIRWPTIDGHARWDVEASVTNTDVTTSTNWIAFLYFPYSSGAVVPQYWNV